MHGRPFLIILPTFLDSFPDLLRRFTRDWDVASLWSGLGQHAVFNTVAALRCGWHHHRRHRHVPPPPPLARLAPKPRCKSESSALATLRSWPSLRGPYPCPSHCSSQLPSSSMSGDQNSYPLSLTVRILLTVAYETQG